MRPHHSILLRTIFSQLLHALNTPRTVCACSDLKPGNVLMATRATYGNDTRGFICKARTLLRVWSLHSHTLLTLCNRPSPEAPGVCLTVRVSTRVLDSNNIFCADALLHLRHISMQHRSTVASDSPSLHMITWSNKSHPAAVQMRAQFCVSDVCPSSRCHDPACAQQACGKCMACQAGASASSLGVTCFLISGA